MSASRPTSSRIVKDWFPNQKGQIRVVFDDGERTKALTFHPYDPAAKESRIFGLGGWFSKRGVREGDVISIAVENPETRLYRIALERFVREREAQRARRQLRAARTDAEAAQELNVLSRLTNKSASEVAQEELLRIAEESSRQPRPSVSPSASERHEGVPPRTRVLLRELHHGRCQLCSFTFEKRNGQPYFEIHHLDPAIGHHPTNLLVLCPNCHAQFEHATLTDFEWADRWLVGVTINGKRFAVRQPLAHDPIRRALFGWGAVIVALQIGRLLVQGTGP